MSHITYITYDEYKEGASTMTPNDHAVFEFLRALNTCKVEEVEAVVASLKGVIPSVIDEHFEKKWDNVYSTTQ